MKYAADCMSQALDRNFPGEEADETEDEEMEDGYRSYDEEDENN